jgi:hypothetical protein
MIGIGYEYRLGISHLGVTANMGYVSKYNDFKENIITLISLNIGFIL